MANAQKAGAREIFFEDQAKLDAAFPDMLKVWEDSMCAKNMCEQAKSVIADTKKVMGKTAK